MSRLNDWRRDAEQYSDIDRAAREDAERNIERERVTRERAARYRRRRNCECAGVPSITCPKCGAPGLDKRK